MTSFGKLHARIAVATSVAALFVAPAAHAQGLGAPIVTPVDFPTEGAFDGRPGTCLLLVCTTKPEVTQDEAPTGLTK